MRASATTVIEPRLREADGLQIRYAATGSHAHPLLLLLNPWPESIYAWETIWPILAEQANLVAIDLPGFGKSERRDDLLSPSGMGDFLLRLIDEWGLDAPHVVGPDIGTGATLSAAANRPDFLTSASVGSGGSSYPLDVRGTLEQLINAPDIEAFRAQQSADVINGAMQALERHELSSTARDDYIESYSGDRWAESIRYVRSYPEELQILGERLAGIETPVQIITGARDSLVPPSNAEYLASRLPKSRLRILDTGHFAWEDAAEDYASLLLEWVGGSYLNV
jgi:pimeloyl-ACP methyl ester carboxylesterase